MLDSSGSVAKDQSLENDWLKFESSGLVDLQRQSEDKEPPCDPDPRLEVIRSSPWLTSFVDVEKSFALVSSASGRALRSRSDARKIVDYEQVLKLSAPNLSDACRAIRAAAFYRTLSRNFDAVVSTEKMAKYLGTTPKEVSEAKGICYNAKLLEQHVVEGKPLITHVMVVPEKGGRREDWALTPSCALADLRLRSLDWWVLVAICRVADRAQNETGKDLRRRLLPPSTRLSRELLQEVLKIVGMGLKGFYASLKRLEAAGYIELSWGHKLESIYVLPPKVRVDELMAVAELSSEQILQDPDLRTRYAKDQDKLKLIAKMRSK